MIKQYLSYGGGVNSTALLLLMHEQGHEFESVFVDHGGDWPETYEYVEMIRQKYPVTVIKPEYKREKGKVFNSIYDFMVFRNLVPLRQNRWCTANFKIQPFENYYAKPCTVFIGIGAEEARRAKPARTEGITHRWPLIEQGINRQDCESIIRRHGLPVPMKSGCWFCPFQRVSQLKELYAKHPDLFQKLVELEKRSIEYATSKGRSKHNSTLIKPHLVEGWVGVKQGRLF